MGQNLLLAETRPPPLLPNAPAYLANVNVPLRVLTGPANKQLALAALVRSALGPTLVISSTPHLWRAYVKEHASIVSKFSPGPLRWARIIYDGPQRAASKVIPTLTAACSFLWVVSDDRLSVRSRGAKPFFQYHDVHIEAPAVGPAPVVIHYPCRTHPIVKYLKDFLPGPVLTALETNDIMALMVYYGARGTQNNLFNLTVGMAPTGPERCAQMLWFCYVFKKQFQGMCLKCFDKPSCPVYAPCCGNVICAECVQPACIYCGASTNQQAAVLD